MVTKHKRMKHKRSKKRIGGMMSSKVSKVAKDITRRFADLKANPLGNDSCTMTALYVIGAISRVTANRLAATYPTGMNPHDLMAERVIDMTYLPSDIATFRRNLAEGYIPYALIGITLKAEQLGETYIPAENHVYGIFFDRESNTHKLTTCKTIESDLYQYLEDRMAPGTQVVLMTQFHGRS